MECPNCEFQNTPGTKMCVRCQSRLDLGAVDIVPPRSGASLAWRGPLYRMRSLGHRVGDAVAAISASVRIAFHPDVNWAHLFWSVVPGLGHMLAGYRRTGRLILAGWIALLALAVLTLSDTVSWMLGAGALGLHCFVYSLLLAKPLRDAVLIRRIIIGVGIYLVLLLGLYAPVVFVARNTVTIVPVNGIFTTDTIDNGDVLLGRGRWLRPDDWQRGDLVYYRIDPGNAMAAAGIAIQDGYGVDRIIGMEGDHVVYDGKQLTVNGEPLPRTMMPIGGLIHIPELDILTERGEVIVLPSALRWRFQGAAMQGAVGRVILSAARVPRRDLRSRIEWRLRPWRRFGDVH